MRTRLWLILIIGVVSIATSSATDAHAQQRCYQSCDRFVAQGLQDVLSVNRTGVDPILSKGSPRPAEIARSVDPFVDCYGLEAAK